MRAPTIKTPMPGILAGFASPRPLCLCVKIVLDIKNIHQDCYSNCSNLFFVFKIILLTKYFQ